MELKGLNIGFVLTGAFPMIRETIPKIKDLVKEEATIIPIMSNSVYNIDTEYGKAEDFVNEVQKITGKEVIHTINGIEPIIKSNKIDLMIIAPCTGNTISKLAMDIADTIPTIAVKFHLKYEKPVVIAVSSGNGLGADAENIGKLLNRKNYYFVPFRQNNPITKPRSIAYDQHYIVKTIKYALDGEQISPILL